MALREAGMPVLHLLIGPAGPGGAGGGVVGLTPNVTGHVGRSGGPELFGGGNVVREDQGDIVDFFP